jgi:hypothetical protein
MEAYVEIGMMKVVNGPGLNTATIALCALK